MKAFIITGDHIADLNPLSQTYAGCLSPLLDRPWLQHLVEVLVNKGVKDFHFFASDHPQQIEKYFESGKRWGTNFTYHIGADETTLFKQIQIQCDILKGEKILLCQANCIYFDVPDFTNLETQGVLKITAATEAIGANDWLVFDPEFWRNFGPIKSFGQLEGAIVGKLAPKVPQVHTAKEFLRFNDLKDLLTAQSQVMENLFPQLMCNANEIEPKIRVSRNVMLSPTAKIIPPVFIGENCQISEKVTLGPNVVVSANCIVDAKSSIANSIIFPGSYVGESLNVSNSFVKHNQLINLDIGGEISLSEDFILGSLSDHPFMQSVINGIWRFLAAILLLVFSPMLILIAIFLLVIKGRKNLLTERICIKNPAKSIHEVSTFSLFSFAGKHLKNRKIPYHPIAHFFLSFLPGLISVIKGNQCIVGLPVRTLAEFKALPEDHKKIFLKGQSGLVTESQVFWQNKGTTDELLMAETFHMAKRSFWYDLHLLVKYFLSMLSLPK